jgi:hypothetical protein
MTTDQRLLAEDLLLLAYDPATGRQRSSVSAQLAPAIGGALLVELALRDRLRIEVDVPRASSRPTGDPLLDEVARQLREGPRRRKLKGWVSKVGTTARRDQVRGRLVAAGRLIAEEQRILGLYTRTRVTLTATSEAERLAEAVRAVLQGSRTSDERLTVLAALVGGTAILDKLVPAGERRAARQRATELAEDSPAAHAARAVIRDTQAAVLASITAGAGVAAGR